MGAMVEAETNDHALKALIEQKERELGELAEYRINQLEENAARREEELRVANARLEKLKEDFKYNVTLIEERDAELESLEATCEGLRETLEEKERALSSASIEAAESKRLVECGEKSALERESFWQAKLRQAREETDVMRWTNAEAMRKQREAEERLKAEWAAKLREAVEAGAAARHELASVLEEAARRRETETRCRDEAAAEARRAAESRAESLERRAESMRASKAEVEAALETSGARIRDLEQQLQRERWEREDEAKRSEAREIQVEERLARAKAAAAKAETEGRSASTGLLARVDTLTNELANCRQDAETGSARLAECERKAETQQRKHEELMARKEAECEARLKELRRHAEEERMRTQAEMEDAKTLFKESIAAQRAQADSERDGLRGLLSEARARYEAREAQVAESLTAKDREIEKLSQELLTRMPAARQSDDTKLSLTERVEAALNTQQQMPGSPLFSEDAGGAASLLAGLVEEPTGPPPPSPPPNAIVAAMRAELEAIKNQAARTARERDEELRRLDAHQRAERRAEARTMANRVDGLERDLSSAHKKLVALSKERSKLMEMSNALRAQLRSKQKAGEDNRAPIRTQLRDRAENTETAVSSAIGTQTSTATTTRRRPLSQPRGTNKESRRYSGVAKKSEGYAPPPRVRNYNIKDDEDDDDGYDD